MAKKPEGDLGAMAISKAKAADTVPFAAAPRAAPEAGGIGGVKSLTVKLDGDTYAALRTYCYEQERATGARLTHQQVMVKALKSFLESRQ
jgi:hypothetical protein